MTAFSHCPDCSTPLGKDRTKCRCGWVMPAERSEAAARPIVHCDTVGCEQPAFNRVDGKNLCRGCEDRIRHEQAEAFCRSKGLDTVEQRRAYCKQQLRNFGRGVPSFERWARAMTQKTIDYLVLADGADDRKVLERLFYLGVIDEHRKLIPLDQREARRGAMEAARKAERERIEAALAAQGVVRRNVDTEAA
jgi:hypothetical protein